jgi:hypothetical protein
MTAPHSPAISSWLALLLLLLPDDLSFAVVRSFEARNWKYDERDFKVFNEVFASGCMRQRHVESRK